MCADCMNTVCQPLWNDILISSRWIISQTIHVCHVYPHFMDFYGKRRKIYRTWMVSVLALSFSTLLPRRHWPLRWYISSRPIKSEMFPGDMQSFRLLKDPLQLSGFLDSIMFDEGVTNLFDLTALSSHIHFISLRLGWTCQCMDSLECWSQQ